MKVRERPLTLTNNLNVLENLFKLLDCQLSLYPTPGVFICAPSPPCTPRGVLPLRTPLGVPTTDRRPRKPCHFHIPFDGPAGTTIEQPIVHQGPTICTSSNSHFTSCTPPSWKMVNFSLCNLNFCPNFGSQVPIFGNFQFTRTPSFRGSDQLTSTPLHTPLLEKKLSTEV